MKIKKMFMLLICMTMLLTFSNSAYAISGNWDTQDTAAVLQTSNEVRNLWLSEEADEDWFQYTNTTGSNQFVYASLDGTNIDPAWNLSFKIKYSRSVETNLLQGTGGRYSKTISNILLPHGATIFYKINLAGSTHATDINYKLTQHAN
ncbi:hypothetical protein [Paenibacillus sp. L3-i20]|uniref:hypothetical protein n=1 Tax=Paenibacillus sp. L3-i20 TaxID=2905833 RepID=UPI001EE069A5|nr:hypothetical protein [Paenibacillus sp. L3-i20]GKU80067.1 hypothetical protein L3i20_v244640 [Paenibacillus sp. L3-i20]